MTSAVLRCIVDLSDHITPRSWALLERPPVVQLLEIVTTQMVYYRTINYFCNKSRYKILIYFQRVQEGQKKECGFMNCQLRRCILQPAWHIVNVLSNSNGVVTHNAKRWAAFPAPQSLPLLPYLTGSNVCFIKISVMWFYRNDPWLVWYDEIIHRLRGFLKSAAIFWSGRFDGGDMHCVCWLRIVVTACYVSSSLLL
jgi:hypothetical protein